MRVAGAEAGFDPKPTLPFPSRQASAERAGKPGGESEEDVLHQRQQSRRLAPAGLREGGSIYHRTGRRRLCSETAGFEVQLCLFAVCFG